MEFRVLGPVEVLAEDGRPVPVSAARVRTLLAALLMRAGQVISTDDLVDQLWAHDPPANPRSAVQNYVRRLREIVGPELVETRPGGYRITAEPADLRDFRRYAAEAARETDPAAEVELLAQALAGWRGDPLGDVDSEALQRHDVPRLLEERLGLVERRIDARLRLGEHAALIPELIELTRSHPVRERFWSQLMVALYRAGRQADALAAYDELAAGLVDQLGIDPGADLRTLRQAVLTNAPELAAPVHRPAELGWRPLCQLPLDLRDFVGRDELADAIEDELSVDSGIPIVALSGSPGVGKSALAIRIAHRMRPAFPDGQWYIQLNGAGQRPADPLDVLAELLVQCGADPAQIPARIDARAAALRARLADRRLLLFLDDALDAEQIRPLLPGAGGCAVLATSRQDLGGLVALHGGFSRTLDVLSPDEAAALVVRTVGVRAVEADPEAASDLVELCGYLPLAVRIAAANVVSRANGSIAGHVAELRRGPRLTKLSVGGDPRFAVRAAFDLSYDALAPEVGRLFRLLGSFPGPEVTVPAAAALADIDEETAGRCLETLVRVNLLQRATADRYRFHDLIKLYAEELGTADRPDGVRRLADWYVRTAHAAVQFEFVRGIGLPRPAADQVFEDAAAARSWLDEELTNLVAIATTAGETGDPAVAWQLGDILRHYLSDRTQLVQWRLTSEAGLRAARAAGHHGAEAVMLQSLGILAHTIGDAGAAFDHWYRALASYRRSELPTGEPALLTNLAVAHCIAGEPRRSLTVLGEARALFAELDEPMPGWQSVGLLNESYAHLHIGDLAETVREATECAALGEGQPTQALSALANRGVARRLLGDHDAAVADLETAGTTGRRESRYRVWADLAICYAEVGRVDEARRTAERALAESLDLPLVRAQGLLATAAVEHRHGEPAAAVAAAKEALRLADVHQDKHHQVEARVTLAEAQLRLGDTGTAAQLAGEALTAARESEYRILECRALLVLGRIADSETAAGLRADAGRICRQTGYQPLR